MAHKMDEAGPPGKSRKLNPDDYRWYRRDPSRALAGMRELNPEQRGVYCTLIELVYEARGPIADNDVSRAMDCKCDIRRYRRIKAELLAVERIVVRDGMIYDERAVRELVAKQVFSEKQSERARAPRPKRRTRNKVVRIVVHEGGLSPDAARQLRGTVQPKSPPASLNPKAKNLAKRAEGESISNGGAKTGSTEAPRRPAAKGGGASAKREPSNVKPLPARATTKADARERQAIALAALRAIKGAK